MPTVTYDRNADQYLWLGSFSVKRQKFLDLFGVRFDTAEEVATKMFKMAYDAEKATTNRKRFAAQFPWSFDIILLHWLGQYQSPAKLLPDFVFSYAGRIDPTFFAP